MAIVRMVWMIRRAKFIGIDTQHRLLDAATLLDGTPGLRGPRLLFGRTQARAGEMGRPGTAARSGCLSGGAAQIMLAQGTQFSNPIKVT